MRITSKQFRKIILEEIQFALELPAQYDDEDIESCPEPASVVDAWYPSDVIPEEDAWAGGDNLEGSVDWAHTATGESNAGPHIPIESSTTIDDNPLAQRTLEDVIAAILGGSLHEALLEQSDDGDSQEDDAEEDEDDGDEEKDDGDDARSAGGADTENQPEMDEQLTLSVRNKGSWQQWSGGKDTDPAHDIYESLRQLIRHGIITEQNIECGSARFSPNRDEVFVPTARGFIGSGSEPRSIHKTTEPRSEWEILRHVKPISVSSVGVHTVTGYIMPRQDAQGLHVLANSPHIRSTSVFRMLLGQEFKNNKCGTIYFQTLSNAEDVPPIELWKSYESSDLGDLGWGTSQPTEPEPVYASPEPPDSPE